MTSIAILVVVLLVAFLVEAMVEYFLGIPLSKIPKLAPYTWALVYVAAIVGVVGAYVYQLDLINIISSQVGTPVPINHFGLIMTGLAIGRGSNFLHDLFAKFAARPAGG